MSAHVYVNGARGTSTTVVEVPDGWYVSKSILKWSGDAGAASVHAIVVRDDSPRTLLPEDFRGPGEELAS